MARSFRASSYYARSLESGVHVMTDLKRFMLEAVGEIWHDGYLYFDAEYSRYRKCRGEYFIDAEFMALLTPHELSTLIEWSRQIRETDRSHHDIVEDLCRRGHHPIDLASALDKQMGWAYVSRFQSTKKTLANLKLSLLKIWFSFLVWLIY